MKQYAFRKKTVLLFFALGIILFSRTYISMLNANNTLFIQQDNYTGYVQALVHGTLASPAFGDYERRLFPGLPLLIYIISFGTTQLLLAGIIISIVSSLSTAYLLWKLSKSALPTLLSVIFPPVWIKQGAKSATEPLFTAIALASLYTLIKKKYFLTGILIGITCTIRPIGIVLLISSGLLLVKKHKKPLLSLTIGFVLPIMLLLLFNYSQFGSKEILEQFIHGERYGGFRLGFFQIANDLYRTIAWHQYRIFFSGLFYILINLLALWMLYKKRNQSFLTKFSFLWLLFSLLFILTPSPFTLLDDFGRYSLAGLPSLLIGLSLMFDKNAGEQETSGKI